MIRSVRTLKTLADENRLRLLMLLKQKELFVCQIMAISGLSQSLISRSLALLDREGLLDSRRKGKQVFYSLKPGLPPLATAVLSALETRPEADTSFSQDRLNLELFCQRFQHGRAACDMDIVRAFIEFRNKNQKKGVPHGET